jgi:ribosomal protein L11 methylase PrmA
MPSNFGYFPSPPTDTFPLGFDHANENTRQVSLHYALKHLSAHTGMNAWGIIKEHLKVVHEEGRRSSVLDLGCGTGIFCYELGKEEEFADVIGVE